MRQPSIYKNSSRNWYAWKKGRNFPRILQRICHNFALSFSKYWSMINIILPIFLVFFTSILFWGHSGVTLWCDFQCLTSDSSHSFSLCSLKILQWFVRRPDEDGLSASLLKQWSNMKDYIKDVSLPPTFLIVHFVVCFSRWMHACICTIWFLFPSLYSRRNWLSHFVRQFSLNVFWLSFFSANLIHI